ncbi:uncharacterized protein BDZ83DRAFT_601255 [Colletotrichum acutatum]|uniref:Uncharacterized protein n=1 Tax=Glomerella acutata TaxID=27357 RepID=A0AAD8XND5_GLOAC|nr:uncharacterized protein BDZ83DRAFT_601255 [Colletotrichum acutatum]KAK1730473.1 hypothetical protein BDZ83DRAFT_601255 [Colletotrichum acutatum]
MLSSRKNLLQWTAMSIILKLSNPQALTSTTPSISASIAPLVTRLLRLCPILSRHSWVPLVMYALNTYLDRKVIQLPLPIRTMFAVPGRPGICLRIPVTEWLFYTPEPLYLPPFCFLDVCVGRNGITGDTTSSTYASRSAGAS